MGSAFYRLLAWAKDYYEQQRAKGKPRNTVLRPLAFKWIAVNAEAASSSCPRITGE